MTDKIKQFFEEYKSLCEHFNLCIASCDTYDFYNLEITDLEKNEAYFNNLKRNTEIGIFYTFTLKDGNNL